MNNKHNLVFSFLPFLIFGLGIFIPLIISEIEGPFIYPLHYAARDGNLEKVKKCISKGIPIDLRDGGKCTALILASKFGHTDVVTFFIENGADINAINSRGDTPLIAAAGVRGERCGIILINNGADINKTDSLGNTALHEACATGKLELAKALIEHGAELNPINNYGQTPFDMQYNGKATTTNFELRYYLKSIGAKRYK